jgi:hypothetical protein
MKQLKYVNFLGHHIHFVLFGMIAIIVLGLTFSLFTFINSYQEVVQNGMLASLGSIEYPR